MKKKRKGRWKQPVASVLGMGLVVGLTIVGTLAFLQTKSNEKSNVFTGSNDIKLYLEEPNYNVKYTYNNDGTINTTDKGTLKFQNELDPRQYIPGEIYLKDPTLYNTTGQQVLKSDANTTELANEWVAMRVDYSIGSELVTYTQLTQDGKENGYSGKGGIIETITFDEDDLATTAAEEGKWIKITKAMCSTTALQGMLPEKGAIYLYKYRLVADADVTQGTDGTNDLEDKNFADMRTYQTSTSPSTKSSPTVKTSPLFQQIELKKQSKLETNGYPISDLPTFYINLKGGAIKDMVTITTDEIVDVTVTPTNGDTKQDAETYTPNQKKAGSQKVIDALVELLGDQS